MEPTGRDPRKCAARTTAGNPCGRWAVLGATVCATHGASAPQVREAARRRVAEAEARAVAGRLIDDADAGPIEDPLGALLALGGRLQAATLAVGDRVNALESLTGRGPGGAQTVRPELLVWQSLLSELRMTLVSVARLDLDERLGKITAAQGAQVSAAFTALVNAVCGIVGGGPEVREAVHGAAREILTGLRDGRYAA